MHSQDGKAQQWQIQPRRKKKNVVQGQLRTELIRRINNAYREA
jgi:hypothetical protein